MNRVELVSVVAIHMLFEGGVVLVCSNAALNSTFHMKIRITSMYDTDVPYNGFQSRRSKGSAEPTLHSHRAAQVREQPPNKDHQHKACTRMLKRAPATCVLAG